MQRQHTRFDAIAIDGPAASGKSTVAKVLAQTLELTMVNSGEMYRAVTLSVLQDGANPSSADEVSAILKELDLSCIVEDGASRILISGAHPGEALRSETVNAAVSAVSAIPEVRRKLVELQRSLLNQSDLVMEGRDIGSVVFPETPYKIYIEASEAVRNKRRADEGLSDSVSERDRLDRTRKTAPLIVPDGAVVIDSSQMTINEVVEQSLGNLRELGWFTRNSQTKVE
ncbi:MAG: (d)CMP kinase [Verrucomicrobia bacterium]|jgi:cytidylate kinase|nr:MAG: (d)CMP kinase [Verrucomicrobiota bacterium]